MLKLFLINCRAPIVEAFRSMGHEVVAVDVGENFYDVARKAAELEFDPDLLIQQENLGKRVFLNNLSALSCTKFFWSVDTHLNLHWHSIYSRLFDAVLTTQKKYISEFRKYGIIAYWVPWMGVKPGAVPQLKGIKPYHKRLHEITFIGRVSGLRKSRKWFLDFISSRYSLNVMDGLTYSGMLEVYRDTRIVPNEAILNEVNFRLFEACSCACAVVTPDVGEELEELFEPGKEIEVYGNVLELGEILDRLTKDKKAAERLALKGYARVLEDHLPENRARSILELTDKNDKNKVDYKTEKMISALVQAELIESGNYFFTVQEVCGWLKLFRNNTESDTALIRLYALEGESDNVAEFAAANLKNSEVLADAYSCMSFSLSCWRCGLWDLAKFFWYGHCEHKGYEKVSKPENETELLILWAKDLYKYDRIIRSGVLFHEDKDIPACAVDCLSAAFFISPKNLEVSRLMQLYLDKVGGRQPMRVGFLSHLSLYYPEDWRIALDLAASSLETFRFDQGLSELKHAERLAAEQGQQGYFNRLLSHRKLSGYKFSLR